MNEQVEERLKYFVSGERGPSNEDVMHEVLEILNAKTRKGSKKHKNDGETKKKHRKVSDDLSESEEVQESKKKKKKSKSKQESETESEELKKKKKRKKSTDDDKSVEKSSKRSKSSEKTKKSKN